MGKINEVSVLAPVTGHILSLASVQDPVFATGKMGPGFGIQPTTSQIVAPVSGRVTLVAATKHAIGIVTTAGLEVLIHLGIDTVALNGVPFTLHVQVGDEVAAGALLADMDLAAVKQAHKLTTVLVIVTNGQNALTALTVLPLTKPVAAGGVAAIAHLAVVTTEAATMGSSTNHTVPRYQALATAIIANVGGQQNINSVIHCITRLRFYLKDEALAHDSIIANLDGVIDVAKAGGQYQVVIGPAVNDVFDAVIAQLGPEFIAAKSVSPTTTTINEKSWLRRVRGGISGVIGVMTASMTPVIGILAGSGILKGILAALTGFKVLTVASGTYMVLNAVADAMFYFLPVVLGFTAAKKLGSDPIVLAIVGGILIYPSLITAASKGATAQITFLGVPTHLMSYSASVFPMIVAAWLGTYVERGLKRVIPLYLRSVFIPIIEALILAIVVLVVVGPLITIISKGMANGLVGVYNFSPALSGLVIGSLYQTMVIFGLHWGIIPIVINDIATNGHSYLNAILSITMVAQGGAVLAVFLKSKNKHLKEISLAAAISAFCGVTEPALYGVNLKYKRVFIVASIASGLGGLLTGLLRVNNYALSGSLIGFPAFITPGVGIGTNFYGYLISHYGTLVLATTLVYLFGFSDKRLGSKTNLRADQ
ncbi:PTS beta-glucoside transporter subunit IIABC [Lactiplantibacillus paraplantarum]|nr:PTS beta-glucoside transporter subunit IIABC [Lactiplantibacillus paraplantarum]KGE76088.1 PTS beta-glucoside transporter subunit IIABC [Lactiplantibacillus paraplantarum]OAX75591.1 PTS beta-glucoside transporter subunit IIABC [Lactiplantibacillus plantarum]RDG10476.1 PTS beta-glucoside transporter subunit IIABC [Lactiplantibacillus paraplantarum]